MGKPFFIQQILLSLEASSCRPEGCFYCSIRRRRCFHNKTAPESAEENYTANGRKSAMESDKRQVKSEE
jgi:hypothetical protein